MEGALSKWTNMMKGWQQRFFVLDEQTLCLNYYTSREKVRRDVKRGKIFLKGAIIGILLGIIIPVSCYVLTLLYIWGPVIQGRARQPVSCHEI